MKNIFLISLVILGFVFTFTSCEKNDYEPKYKANATVTPAITNPVGGSELTLLLADSANPVVFDWSAATYAISEGVLSNPVYSLSIVQADSSWDKAVELINTTDLKYETIVFELNNVLYLLGLTPEEPTTLKLRVSSIIGTVTTTSTMSEEISFTATIFEPPTPPLPSDPSMWVPGAYQGWSPADAPQIWDVDADSKFEGYVHYPEIAGFDGHFKFTANPAWVDDANYGTDGTEFGLDNDSGASDLEIPGPGGYWLTCDIVNMIWSYEAQSWGVIGSGVLDGDWTEDVDLVYDESNMTLTVTTDIITPPDGSDLRFKFRANDAWDLNLGQGEGANELSYGGSDILMPEGPGNYTFILDMGTPIPTYEFILNGK